MCLTRAATVLEVRSDQLVIDLDGRPTPVDSLLVPDARVGDEVLVGVGRALSRLTATEARRLRELHAALDQPTAHEPAAVAAGAHHT
jgi:hydrogenase expression/formation protein HypC